MLQNTQQIKRFFWYFGERVWCDSMIDMSSETYNPTNIVNRNSPLSIEDVDSNPTDSHRADGELPQAPEENITNGQEQSAPHPLSEASGSFFADYLEGKAQTGCSPEAPAGDTSDSKLIAYDTELDDASTALIDKIPKIYKEHARRFMNPETPASFNSAVRSVKLITKATEPSWVVRGFAAHSVWVEAEAGKGGYRIRSEKGKMAQIRRLVDRCQPKSNADQIATNITFPILYNYALQIDALYAQPMQAFEAKTSCKKAIAAERNAIMERLFVVPEKFIKIAVTMENPPRALEIAYHQLHDMKNLSMTSAKYREILSSWKMLTKKQAEEQKKEAEVAAKKRTAEEAAAVAADRLGGNTDFSSTVPAIKTTDVVRIRESRAARIEALKDLVSVVEGGIDDMIRASAEELDVESDAIALVVTSFLLQIGKRVLDVGLRQ